MKKRISIGVDVGGSHISCKSYDLSTNELLQGSFTHLPINNKWSANELFKAFEILLKPCIDAANEHELAGIGLAFPGPIDYEKGIGLFKGDNSKYLSLYNVNIRNELSKRLGVETQKIRFVNDATAFAFGEYATGQLKGAKKGLAITLGTGFGAAFLDEGVPVIDDERVPKGGCLWYLSFDKTIADDYFSTRGLVERFTNSSGNQVEGVKEIADLYPSDVCAQTVFNDFGSKLALFLTPWLKKFEVDKIVIGGNISRAFTLFNNSFNIGLKEAGLTINVNPSSKLEDSAFIGAAMLLDDDFYNSIKKQLKLM